MEDTEMVCEKETEEMDDIEIYETAQWPKWLFVTIGAIACAGIGGAVMFVKNKLGGKNVEDGDSSETETPKEANGGSEIEEV